MAPWWDSTPGYQNEHTQPSSIGMRFDVFHHVVNADLLGLTARLDRIESQLAGLLRQGNNLMATTQELLDAVTSLATAFQPLPAAIDALEAAVQAVGGIPEADQANIDAAVQALRDVTVQIAAAVTDATDGTAT